VNRGREKRGNGERGKGRKDETGKGRILRLADSPFRLLSPLSDSFLMEGEQIDMFIIISYDIGDDKQRNKIAKLLEAHGTRVQYSVFECNLTEMQLANLKKKLARTVQPDDSIRFYRLCRECVGRVEIIGAGEVTVERQYYMV